MIFHMLGQMEVKSNLWNIILPIMVKHMYFEFSSDSLSCSSYQLKGQSEGMLITKDFHTCGITYYL